MTTINNLLAPVLPGLLCVSGEQAKKFLQGQLTCHMDEVTPSHSLLGAHCNPQGRVISLFRIFLRENNYYLQMPRELIPIAKQALQKYAVFFKTSLVDSEIFSETQSANWHMENIRKKIPSIFPETSEKFLPHDLNLPELGAVSFNKGCYTGQEIIARMQYRGKLKNHLYHAVITTPLDLIRGADIFIGNKAVGNMVDFCKLNDKQYENNIFYHHCSPHYKKCTNAAFLICAFQVYLRLI